MSDLTEETLYRGLIGELADRRIQQGLSQNELDERLGLTRGHIGKWETGRRRPTAWNLSNWAYVLGLRLVTAPRSRRTSTRSPERLGQEALR